MNWHQLIEERSYEMHRVIAAVLRHDQSKLTRVQDWIENCLSDPDYSIHSKDALRELLKVIEERGVEGRDRSVGRSRRGRHAHEAKQPVRHLDAPGGTDENSSPL